MTAPSCELPGLTARLDRLCHHHGGASLPEDKPHAFVYYITLSNGSDRSVTLLARKWILEYEDGSRSVLEGDGIVGETPRLAPGEAFSYNSYHVTGCNAVVRGAFHGVDSSGNKIHTLLPPFALKIPEGKV
ncbi:magnesium transporter [Cephaloticoccus primus]|uniref:Magnesium transporter n=1 Tax=Cephaloticoccus primus TaxID=1548207 RepID=A0A139SJI8_9BACT|nr:ApaG domain [Cephaloticoccus primus]KXU34735.1 magnesium transporter [Cephaloticoccus primus]